LALSLGLDPPDVGRRANSGIRPNGIPLHIVGVLLVLPAHRRLRARMSPAAGLPRPFPAGHHPPALIIINTDERLAPLEKG
jgi:hypothetical protein